MARRRPGRVRHGTAARLLLRGMLLGVDGPAVRQQGDVWILQRRAYPLHLRIRFGMHQAREAVARSAANAGAERPILFVEHNPVWRVERVIAGLLQVVRELLDTRFV